MLVKFIYKKFRPQHKGGAQSHLPIASSTLIFFIFFLNNNKKGGNKCIDYSYKFMEWGTARKKIRKPQSTS